VGQVDVYTLTIAHDHTFFVGTARVLVHNADPAHERISLAVIRYADRYGHLMGGQINQLIGSEQRALLREFFGQGLPGVRERFQNFQIPTGLTNDTLLKYAVIAWNAVLNANTLDKSGLQAARLRLIVQALRERGLQCSGRMRAGGLGAGMCWRSMHRQPGGRVSTVSGRQPVAGRTPIPHRCATR
jgi:hypothetical protein